ncbi:hypothetical protein [Salsuginibacillus kocurii]|uniref:hypothetical protein n=1 Tax=Salsuginibacillus kocurii TaxID=427078 RepID=UPI00035EA38A|nr:hypothetical protein [Salsuginibacillus kocurii]
MRQRANPKKENMAWDEDRMINEGMAGGTALHAEHSKQIPPNTPKEKETKPNSNK